MKPWQWGDELGECWLLFENNRRLFIDNRLLIDKNCRRRLMCFCFETIMESRSEQSVVFWSKIIIAFSSTIDIWSTKIVLVVFSVFVLKRLWKTDLNIVLSFDRKQSPTFHRQSTFDRQKSSSSSVFLFWNDYGKEIGTKWFRKSVFRLDSKIASYSKHVSVIGGSGRVPVRLDLGCLDSRLDLVSSTWGSVISELSIDMHLQVEKR